MTFIMYIWRCRRAAMISLCISEGRGQPIRGCDLFLLAGFRLIPGFIMTQVTDVTLDATCAWPILCTSGSRLTVGNFSQRDYLSGTKPGEGLTGSHVMCYHWANVRWSAYSSTRVQKRSICCVALGGNDIGRNPTAGTRDRLTERRQ